MNILVVHAHPDPQSFNAAICARVVSTFERRGHVVHVDDLYADEFQPRLTAEEHEQQFTPGVDPSLQRYADNLRWCDALVFVYPTWWSGPPAMLKGWMDRVFARGVAWDLPVGASSVRGRLRNVKRIVGVTTYGSSRRVNMLEGEAGKRIIRRTVRALCNPMTRTTWLALYSIDTSSHDDRIEFLKQIDTRLSRW